MIRNYAIGSYTTAQPHVPDIKGIGISILSMETETGDLSLVNTDEGIGNPSYLRYDKEMKKLYAVTEYPNNDGEIVSYKILPGPAIERDGSQPGPGTHGSHLISLADSNRLYAIAYMAGCIKGYPLKNGIPDAADYEYQYRGSGPDKIRQDTAHAHQVLRSPDGRFLYVCDLGTDTIWKHDLNSKDHHCEPALKVPPGYGPRHIVFDPVQSVLYVVCELIPKIITTSIETDGKLKMLGEIETTVGKDDIKAAPAAIRMHPSGRCICVANRFRDTVTVFQVNRNNAGEYPTLELIEEFDCKVRTPRDVEFSPEGDWLIIAGQDSSDIICRRFDSKSGLPGIEWSPRFVIGNPVCIVNID